MSDPTAYHRKLAETLLDSLIGKRFALDALAAVLADKGVVDPEKARAWDVTQDARLLEREQQLAALRAKMDEMDDCREQSIKRGSAQIKAEREVVNLRAKVAEAENMLALAVKGRLMTSVSLHPVEIALAALRAGGSDE